MGYVYLATSRTLPGLLKIGHSPGDSTPVSAHLQAGDPDDVRLIHAIEVPDPGEVERRLHDRFNHARTTGGWLEVGVAEARRAVYDLEWHAASVDARKEFDRFLDSPRFGGGFVEWIVAALTGMVGAYEGLFFATPFAGLLVNDYPGDGPYEYVQLAGIVAGFVAGAYLGVLVVRWILQALCANGIAEKAREIERDYREKYGVEVVLKEGRARRPAETGMA